MEIKLTVLFMMLTFSGFAQGFDDYEEGVSEYVEAGNVPHNPTGLGFLVVGGAVSLFYLHKRTKNRYL